MTSTATRGALELFSSSGSPARNLVCGRSAITTSRNGWRQGFWISTLLSPTFLSNKKPSSPEDGLSQPIDNKSTDYPRQDTPQQGHRLQTGLDLLLAPTLIAVGIPNIGVHFDLWLLQELLLNSVPKSPYSSYKFLQHKTRLSAGFVLSFSVLLRSPSTFLGVISHFRTLQ